MIGGDQVAALPLWHDAAALLAEVHFVVMARPGWAFDWGALPEPFQVLERQVIPAPLVQISSTDVRRRFREGRSARYLIPPAVVDHCLDHAIYLPRA